MISTLLTLLPAGSQPHVIRHLLLTVTGVLLRAVGAVALVPLMAALLGGDPHTAWGWLGLLTAVTVGGWIIDWGASQIGFRLGFGMLDSGQRTVADRITKIRLTWFTAENTATTRQAVAATGPDLVGIIIYLVTPLIAAMLLPLVIAAALLPIAWQLGVAALAGVGVLLAAFWLSGRLSRNSDQAAAVANSRLTERVLEFARTQQALRAARRVEPARSHAGKALESQHAAVVKTLLMQIPGQLLFGIASQVALLLLAGTVVVLTLNGELSTPQAVALLVVLIRYLESFTVIAELSPGLEASIGTLKRIRTVLEAPRVNEGIQSVQPGSAPEILLRNINFSYDAAEGRRVLAGTSVKLEAGRTTAIVGPSGSGKSTVLALIAGLHEPCSGQLLIGGEDSTTFSSVLRHEMVSMVFQHPYLFAGSVRDNVLAGFPQASEAELHRVARLANVDELVKRLPQGWDSPVGEGGGALSGGERQRVSIARALLKPSPVLLVDEATSALDAENESAVAAALADDPVERTRVIVAHRLSSIRTADRVLFVDSGRILEDGTIDELIAADGRFATFWRQQHAAGAWQLGGENDRGSEPYGEA